MNSDSSAPCSTSVPSIITTAVRLHGQWKAGRGSLLTCKCPWYILSTQSVADLSVSGSLDFFHTCEADCRTECWHESLRRSLWTGGPGKHAERSCPLLRCWIWHFLLVQDFSARSQRRRKKRATSDRTFTFSSGVLTPVYDTHRVVYSAAAAGFNRINSSFYKQSLSSLQLSLSPPSLLSASVGRSLRVVTFLGVQSPLVVHSSVLFANYSLWPSPLAPPPVLTYSTRRLTRIKEYLKVSDPLF